MLLRTCLSVRTQFLLLTQTLPNCESRAALGEVCHLEAIFLFIRASDGVDMKVDRTPITSRFPVSRENGKDHCGSRTALVK